MLTSLFRIIKYGIQNFLRNSWLAISTIGIMTLALIVFEGLILFNVLAKAATESLKEKVDISVYFKSNAEEDAILSVKRSLEGLEEVKFVEYVSREKALEEFKEKHKGDDTILQTLEELDENPLLASLNIKAKDLNQYSAIASYLETPSLKDLIEKVTYAQNKIVIERLGKAVKTLNQAIALLTIFLAFLAVIVTFNTIRLAIFTAHEQISIMRLVGGSNTFIRGPFLVEGVIYGIAAAIISFVLFVPIINIISPRIENFVSDISLLSYLKAHWFRLFLYQLSFGLGVSLISSWIAIRKYLRV